MVTDPHTHTHTPTQLPTNRQDRLQYTAPQLVRSVTTIAVTTVVNDNSTVFMFIAKCKELYC